MQTLCFISQRFRFSFWNLNEGKHVARAALEMAAAGQAIMMRRAGETINRKKNWKDFTSWLRKQIREQTMKIQLIWDLKIGTATRTCAYSRKQLRQQRRARVLSCLMRMGVHHTRCASPSGSGREELSHLWSSGGATQRKKNASFCFCAPDPTQEASVGRTACNKKTPAPLSAISPSVAAAVIVAPNCAIAPVINFHSGAIRQTLDGLQQGCGPIHAKWVRGVNLRCLQRLRRFPSVSLSLSASDRLAEAQLRKANNIQRCCSLYCRRSFIFPNPSLLYTFLSCSCVSRELLLLLLFLFPGTSISQVRGRNRAPDVLRRTCSKFGGGECSWPSVGSDSSRSLTVCGASLTDIASWLQFATWLTRCDLKVCDRWRSHTWLTVTIKRSLIQIKHVIYFGRKAIGFFGYLFTLMTVWAHAKDCGRWGNVLRYMQWCYSKERNTHTQFRRGLRTWTVKNCKCRFTSSSFTL